MIKQEIILEQESHQIVINVLDIYQFEIVGLYNEVLNNKKLRTLLYFICRSKGYSPYLGKENGSFNVDLNKYDQYDATNRKDNLQLKYHDAIIHFVKKMLTVYHKKEILRSNSWYEKKSIEFDTQTLNKRERGLLTKILRKENKRLKDIGIIGRRKKKAYYLKIYLDSY